MSSFKMTAKEFRTLTKKDFDNGAIGDEILNALVDREKLLQGVAEIQADFDRFEKEISRLKRCYNEASVNLQYAEAENALTKSLCDQYDEFGRTFQESELPPITERIHGIIAELLTKNKKYREAIKGAIRIKDLWYNPSNKLEHKGELRALSNMLSSLKQTIRE